MRRTATDITLVAVDCAYPDLAIKALLRSAQALPVARVLLLTDCAIEQAGVEIVQIAPIRSRSAYSEFMLKQLGDYIATDYALVVQWDGFVIDGTAWADEFWHYDYVGARWLDPAFEFRVGNGGFSLRSKRLLEALRDPVIVHDDEINEDEAICSEYREHLEIRHGIVFASERVADRFSFEVAHPVGRTLGFHAVFNFWQVMSADELTHFARNAPEAIVQSLGFASLSKNLVDMKRVDMAREFVTRRLAVLPDDVQAQSLRTRLDSLQQALPPSTASTSVTTVSAPASRNDPCPCSSGKRYKACHGLIAASPVAALIDIPALIAEALKLHESGNVQAAVQRYNRVLQDQPENATALHFLGVAHYQSGAPSYAMAMQWLSLRDVTDEAEFFSNYSASAWSAGRYEAGRWAAERALAINPEHIGAMNNLGFNLRSMNDIDGSIVAFDKALTHAPDFDYARWNRTFSLLAKGDYAQGFADYELRLKFPQTQPPGKIPAAPVWQGESIPGKRILLMCEQGLGDTFMFARFVPLVVARGLDVTFVVPHAQVALMQQSLPVVQVIALGEHESMPFDYWAALWSLPSALGITLENLPAPERFLQTQSADVERWAARIASDSSVLTVDDQGERGRVNSVRPEHSQGSDARGVKRIGIVWQGQFAGQDNQMADRSIPPRLMRRFVDALPEITWVSLQHGTAPLGANNVLDWTADTVEFTQMAALIDALDLVISIDTGAAHLAAALGAKTWVLLRHAGDWRYGITGDTCAWSPTMRLFRQDESRRWEPVLAQVAKELRD